MIHSKPLFHIARLVLETRTPLSIGFGRGDGVFDTQLVRDANGLPAIPGSSLAGLLRHLFTQRYGQTAAEALFGRAARRAEEEGSASFVHLSWGVLHDSRDRPVERLLTPEEIEADPLLHDADANCVVRRHVRITHRGTAADGGQFDRTALRAGHRFSVEISLWSERPHETLWRDLLALIGDPGFRLGGATRRGLGALALVGIWEGRFDLSTREGFSSYRQLSPALGDHTGLAPLPPRANPDGRIATAALRLAPVDLFRLGQGEVPVARYAGGEQEKVPDLLPVTERRVVWEGSRGRVDEERFAVIPASAIKGALSHRVAYHHNCLTGRFADELSPGEVDGYDKAGNDAVRALFGEVKGAGSAEGGRAGRVVIDDLYLPLSRFKPVRLMHNGIDRFTGGVRDHVLFSEELLTGPGFALELGLLERRGGDEPPLTAEVVKALRLALEDLAGGRLGLGAGGARGHGLFAGTVTWSGELWNGGGA